MELNKNRKFKILIDGEKVSYEDIIEKRIEFFPDIKLANEYEITIVQWNKKLGKEFSKFYYIDSNDMEKYKEPTKLNKKSDEFFHSVYINHKVIFDYLFKSSYMPV